MSTIRAPDIDPPIGPSAARVTMMYSVMAFMLWPKKGDQAKREAAKLQIHLAHSSHFLRRTSGDGAAMSCGTQEKKRPEYQSALILGLKEPWFPELMLSEADHIARYVTASLVAYFAMAVNPHTASSLGRDAAVGVACAIVNEFGGLSRISTQTLIHQNAQAAMTDWGRNKRAAHLWAAYLVMKMEAPDRDPVFDDFRKFVGISRHFRQVLRSALIRSTALLGLPEGYRYRRIERNIDLDQEVIDLLPFYRGDGDLGHRFEKPELTPPTVSK